MSDFLSPIAEARTAALDGRFDDAADLATRILADSPSCLVAQRILAWAQLELGDDRALESFVTCAAIDPEDALAHAGQAIFHEQRFDTAAAIQSWTRAWELDPHNQAIRRALVKLSGELPESLLADGIGLLRADRPDEAAEVLQQASAERREAASLARLDALWLAGQWRQAFDLALTVLSKQPRSVKAMLYVAALEDRTGRTLHSRELLCRAEQSDPGLILFADVVRHIGLQPALDLARANRGPLLAAR
jgi:tetratricopeptide (TPR) repeat protein